MKVDIYRFIDGSRQAKGATIIIDVFRAFSLECYLYSWGARRIFPVGSISDALDLKVKLESTYSSIPVITIGERQGVKIPEFDFGNSPSQIEPFKDRIKDAFIIHTTSAGTQGIVNSKNSDFVITGSLVNSKAVAQYIKEINPAEVSIVAMGNSGVKIAPEDELCAKYLKVLITETSNSIKDFEETILAKEIENLKLCGGKHFFDEENQEVFPKEDFYMCVKPNIFDFVIRNEGHEGNIKTSSF